MSKPAKVKPPRTGIIEIDPPRHIRTTDGAHVSARWRTFREFKSEDHRTAWEQERWEEEQARVRAAMPKKKAKPTFPRNILPGAEPLPKVNPDAAELCKDESALIVDPALLTLGTTPVLERLYERGTLLQTFITGMGPATVRVGECPDLSERVAISANPLALKPKWKFFVFAPVPGVSLGIQSACRRLQFLARTCGAPLKLALYNSKSCGVEGWFAVDHLDEKALRQLALEAVSLGCDHRSAWGGHSTAMPGAFVRRPGGNWFSPLHAAKIVDTPERYKPRNFILLSGLTTSGK